MSRLHTGKPAQFGLTLVELMVGLAIGLIVSLAASALYLGTRESSRATQSNGDINETAKLALDTIGREIQKAGFYPAQYPKDNSSILVLADFFNGKDTTKEAFDSGIYGCEGATFDTSTLTCPSATSGDPDSIVINYFAVPEFGSSASLGNANDCNRQPVSGDAANTARAASAPVLPLYVSNRFGLKSASYTTVDGGQTVSISTKSLACHGNGNEAATTYQDQYTGIEDMVITYGLYSTSAIQTPDKWLSASKVGAEATVDGIKPWKRVTAVKVCIIVRSLQNARTEEKSGSERTYVDCRGATKKPTDKFIWKRFERVYAVRNNLTG